ncbi:hypothetical protein B0T11DRAFT_317965 [Plectosphaerella cucumerina]|uniref:Uncharacterized protein n=1 Tax=Plectosphaerella cucumerina TaxID=40658 RepID=A0A8K0TL37_9PEZI|nr:hypothetical protein B0T11DRAFT_317965 [Plectosphaerella cucumerina]
MGKQATAKQFAIQHGWRAGWLFVQVTGWAATAKPLDQRTEPGSRGSNGACEQGSGERTSNCKWINVLVEIAGGSRDLPRGSQGAATTVANDNAASLGDQTGHRQRCGGFGTIGCWHMRAVAGGEPAYVAMEAQHEGEVLRLVRFGGDRQEGLSVNECPEEERRRAWGSLAHPRRPGIVMPVTLGLADSSFFGRERREVGVVVPRLSVSEAGLPPSNPVGDLQHSRA